MKHVTQHARILYSALVESLRNARLDSLREEPYGKTNSLILDYQELVLDTAPELVQHQSALAENLQGHYVPRRLRFSGITMLKRKGLYATPDRLAFDHPARNLQGMLYWFPPETAEPLYLLLHGSVEPASLVVSAKQCLAEPRSGPPVAISLTRHWSSPPSLGAGLVPHLKALLQRYGGDPVSIHLGRRVYHRRLFVGGLDHQSETRPDVDVVLNLGEKPSRWTSAAHASQDRWATKGEGEQGMDLDELVREARWVSERLRSGQRILVHCAAGFNRSVTVCCATVIQLEGLSAEDALQRVREHHPWARPDPYHWLMLRWLAHQPAGSASG